MGRDRNPEGCQRVSADGESSGCEFAQPHYLLSVCQEAGDPLKDGGGHRELCQFV